jgi:hypothetical protein
MPFTLTADFGQRTMATQIDQDYRFTTESSVDPILGIHVHGSAPFTNNGSFDIPLSGSVNFASTTSTVRPPEPVSGAMSGALFGPSAEQVGGVFSVNRSGGTVVIEDAFVGQRRR